MSLSGGLETARQLGPALRERDWLAPVCVPALRVPACPRVLLQAYAQHLQPEWFSEAAFLWAVELWYAYAIQVCKGGAAEGRTCLPDCRGRHAHTSFVRTHAVRSSYWTAPFVQLWRR